MTNEVSAISTWPLVAEPTARVQYRCRKCGEPAREEPVTTWWGCAKCLVIYCTQEQRLANFDRIDNVEELNNRRADSGGLPQVHQERRVMDLYAILGVQRDATAAQITKAYRRLAKEHHPDKNLGDAEAEAKFKEVQFAYDVLGDPERRARYDATGEAGPSCDNSMNHAVAVVSEVFHLTMQNLCQRGEDPTKLDVAKLLREGVESMANALRERIEAIDGTSATLRDMESRFSADGEDVVGSIVRGHLAYLAQERQQADAKLAACKVAAELIKGCKYRFEKGKMKPIYTATWATWSSTSTGS